MAKKLANKKKEGSNSLVGVKRGRKAPEEKEEEEEEEEEVVVEPETDIVLGKEEEKEEEEDAGSNIFQSYRVLGKITDGIPFQINRLGNQNFLITSVGHAFQIFNCDHLRVSMVSRSMKDLPIHGFSVIPGNDKFTITFSNTTIALWDRARVVALKRNAHASNIKSILCIGNKVLLSVDENSTLQVWDLPALSEKDHDPLSLVNTIDLKTHMKKITVVMHPHTYLNKVLICGNGDKDDNGKMQLWNFRTQKLVYDFPPMKSSILCVQQSPVVDVVAIGLADGRIVLFNLRFDCEICTFRHASSGTHSIGKSLPRGITSLSFRTDDAHYPSGAGNTSNMLVSADEQGLLGIWNLDDRVLITTVENAHFGPISKISFLLGEPILVTSGLRDNSLKMWIFDQNDGVPRRLKSREGHQLPPSKARFYPSGTIVSTLTSGADATCCQILTAGTDGALRVFHTAREQQSKELSQHIMVQETASHSGLGKKKSYEATVDTRLPNIISFAAMESREQDWCNVITAHRNQSGAFMWNFENRVIGKYVLRPDAIGLHGVNLKRALSDNISSKSKLFPHAQCVCISLCGNFGLVGTQTGEIYKYNLQSGGVRGRYPAEENLRGFKDKLLSEAEKKRIRVRHEAGSIFAFASSSSSEKEGKKKNNSMQMKKKQKLNDDDDHDTKENDIKQEEEEEVDEQHHGPVSGLGVGALNRTLISSGLDGTLRFWEFTTGKLLKILTFKTPISCLEMGRDAGICAIACDDFSVHIVDTLTMKVVRKFMKAHRGRITDLSFSGDSRWLFTSSSDNTVRVWDLPTAKCIDWMEFDDPVTSLTMSPTGEFLATTHIGSVGLHLWANKNHFGNSNIDKICRKPIRMGMRDTKGYFATSNYHSKNDQDEEHDSHITPLEPFKGDSKSSLITLSSSSTSSSSQWYNLAHLDIIRERNKPIQPPSKPESAPFFLPSQLSSFLPQAQDATTTSTPTTNLNASSNPKSQLFKDFKSRTKLLMTLEQCHAESQTMMNNDEDAMGEEEEEEDHRSLLLQSVTNEKFSSKDIRSAKSMSKAYEALVSLLLTMSSSSIDYELSVMTLGPEDEDGSRLLGLWLHWIDCELKSGTNFEIVQAILNRILVLHSDSFLAREELKQDLEIVRKSQKIAWSTLQGLIHRNQCLIRFFSHIT